MRPQTLDEIEAMPLALQVKLLRVLETREITPLGTNEVRRLDLRVVAATKTNLLDLSRRGEFREDLYWRLNVAVLRVPPLSARREDIPLLFLHLMRESAARHKLAEREVPAAFLSGLAAHDWPGNVRELRNLAERILLGLEDPHGPPTSGGTADGMTGGDRLPDRVAQFERSLIAGAIAVHGGRLRAVYEGLGISRKTLYEKMQKYGLDRRLIVEPGDEDRA